MSDLALKQSSFLLPEQLAQLGPEKHASGRKFVENKKYLQAPEKLFCDIVVANWILKSQIKIKLPKIIFFAARLS